MEYGQVCYCYWQRQHTLSGGGNSSAQPILSRPVPKGPKRTQPDIMWPEVGRTLYWLARATRAKRVLELGTGLGYATIRMASAVATQDGRVITIECNPNIAEEARENINAGLLQSSIFPRFMENSIKFCNTLLVTVACISRPGICNLIIST